MMKIFSMAGRLAEREAELRVSEGRFSPSYGHLTILSAIDRAIHLAGKHGEKKDGTETLMFAPDEYDEFKGLIGETVVNEAGLVGVPGFPAYLHGYRLPESDPRNPDAGTLQPTLSDMTDQAHAEDLKLPAPVAKKPTEQDIKNFILVLGALGRLLRQKKADLVVEMRGRERTRRRVTRARQSVGRLARAYSLM